MKEIKLFIEEDLESKRIRNFYSKLIYGKSMQKHLSINDIIRVAVKTSHEMLARNLHKESNNFYPNSKNDTIKCIENLFDNPTINFDKWHKETCEELFNNHKLVVGYSQFIINLALKHIYCILKTYDLIDKFSFNFKPCHFILSSVNFKYLVDNEVLDGMIDLNKIDYDNYYYKQKQIRDYYNIQHKIPFFEEFDAWQ